MSVAVQAEGKPRPCSEEVRIFAGACSHRSPMSVLLRGRCVQASDGRFEERISSKPETSLTEVM
jgi:hypothetical protein